MKMMDEIQKKQIDHFYNNNSIERPEQLTHATVISLLYLGGQSR